MNLDLELLLDYGTIPQAIGEFLMRKHTSTFQNIVSHIKTIHPEDAEMLTRNALSIMIQRRLVKFLSFEKSIKYYFDRKMLQQRLCFAHYLNFIIDNYSIQHKEYFEKVLLNGIYKENNMSTISDQLLDDGILRYNSKEASEGRSTDDSSKHRKIYHKHLIVNFDYLGIKILELETARFISKHLNDAAAEVFLAISKCKVVSRDNIISRLNSTKIMLREFKDVDRSNDLIKYRDLIGSIDAKQNAIQSVARPDNNIVVTTYSGRDIIDEYIQYLANIKVLSSSGMKSKEYFIDHRSRALKIHKFNVWLKKPEMRRLFNMIADHEIEDKDITVRSLLSVSLIKRSIFALQHLGLIVQRCKDEYRSGNRVEHSWALNLEHGSRIMRAALESRLNTKLRRINEFWDVNFFMDHADGNEMVWTSDLLSMATDHLILGLE